MEKLTSIIVALMGIVALITVLGTGVYTIFNGISGDGTCEGALIIGGSFTFILCGLTFPYLWEKYNND